MKAECAWGDGPDVIVSLEGSTMVLHESPNDKDTWEHGTVSDGLLDLTADEAQDLGIDLITAAKQARDMDRMAREHDEMLEEADRMMDCRNQKQRVWQTPEKKMEWEEREEAAKKTIECNDPEYQSSTVPHKRLPG
ncbi:hypothetical protein LCGC14_2247020 [marine sediment metagenome]|uniref:Uncharacterized protein n=1 Tax=marine sediment metagenome TaxID=412755 RepID=A0A0F9FYU0_9ZZZZ